MLRLTIMIQGISIRKIYDIFENVLLILFFLVAQEIKFKLLKMLKRRQLKYRTGLKNGFADWLAWLDYQNVYI